MKPKDYEIIDLPKSRLATLDLGRLYKDKHRMFGLLEVDVTLARRAARSLRSKGQSVSFTAWMIKAIGNAIARNRAAHSMAYRKNKNIVFDGVDIAMPVEKMIHGTPVPIPLLVRETDAKTPQAIQEEIDAALRRPMVDERDFVLGEHPFSRASLRLYYSLPQWARLILMRWLLRNPFRARKHAGTVIVTTVNATGKSAGWILPTRNMHSIAVSFGSITKKPWVVKGEVTIREIMHLTLTFDHDVIDGMPARRFTQDLVSHIEKGILGDGSFES
ncbi:2-oxo acid dehydrogenase subunit E2 [Candidatus Bipolaricaulota bacterium]|nr:2-oxo acid dehydrogenase subunit E2 [Candidatus Bipolaricaulota bacterium]